MSVRQLKCPAFSCIEDPQSFPNIESFKRHVFSVHFPGVTVRDLVFPIITAWIYDHWVARSIDHSGTKYPDTCSLCIYIDPQQSPKVPKVSLENMKSHVLKHIERQLYMCLSCELWHNSADLLKAHFVREHPDVTSTDVEYLINHGEVLEMRSAAQRYNTPGYQRLLVFDDELKKRIEHEFSMLDSKPASTWAAAVVVDKTAEKLVKRMLQATHHLQHLKDFRPAYREAFMAMGNRMSLVIRGAPKSVILEAYDSCVNDVQPGVNGIEEMAKHKKGADALAALIPCLDNSKWEDFIQLLTIAKQTFLLDSTACYCITDILTSRNTTFPLHKRIVEVLLSKPYRDDLWTLCPRIGTVMMAASRFPENVPLSVLEYLQPKVHLSAILN